MSLLSSRLFTSLAAMLCFWLPLEGAEIFRLFSQPLLIPERGEVISYVLLAGSNRFSFLPPVGWRISGDAEKREVVLLSHDQVVSISVKLVDTGIAAKGKQDLDQRREEVVRRYPNAKMVSEASCYSGNCRGICFDFQRIASKNSKLSTRLAFVPFSNGTIEFLLTAPNEKSEESSFTFANFLTSFHSE
jgi:hypothetical protein